MNWKDQLDDELSGIRYSFSESERAKFSRDESSHLPVEPDVICYPTSTEQIVQIIHFASTHSVPITPYGAGSGLDGAAIPLHKGISLSFEEMNRIIEFSPENLTATVQPGITRKTLNQSINRHGLSFPLDPGADASIGGMAATNASGTTAVRYGVMRDQILDMEVVLANGKVIRTGSLARKSSSGYHLNGLFVGSEGTLGIITKITVKLHGIPEASRAATCQFPTVGECTQAAYQLLASGIQVMRMELVDATSIRQINEHGQLNYPEAHSLFLEFAGSPGQVQEELELAEAILSECGAQNFRAAENATESSNLWKARHEIAYAFRHLNGVSVLGSDVCVPLSRLAELADKSRTWIDESGLLGSVFGHIGDGNFHTLIVHKTDDEEERQKAEQINDWIVREAIALGGTSTGEHGVGMGKRKYQQLEHGAAYDVMVGIKQLLDPQNILNPGKVL